MAKLSWVDLVLDDGSPETSTLYIGRKMVGVIHMTKRLSHLIEYTFRLEGGFYFGDSEEPLKYVGEYKFLEKTDKDKFTSVYKESLESFKQSIVDNLIESYNDFLRSGLNAFFKYYEEEVAKNE